MTLFVLFCSNRNERLRPPHTGGNSLANGLAKQFAQLFPLVCGGLYIYSPFSFNLFKKLTL